MRDKGLLLRLGALALIVMLAPAGAGAPPVMGPPGPHAAFKAFVEDLRAAAGARHVAPATFAAVMRGVTPDPAIIRLTQAPQPEFSQPVWAYLAANVSKGRIATGQTNASKWRLVLARAEAQFSVDPPILLAVWAMESGYGAFTGNTSVIRSLTTLAFIRYRGDLFRNELLDALDILQAGDITAAKMQGSWAGAMGQTQFLPSSFKAYAVDFDGDKRRNIWTDVADALGSTGNFLKRKGWIAGEPWGFEVALPKAFDLTKPETWRPASFHDWAQRGLVRQGGLPMPATGSAGLLLPAGLRGPAFLVTPNFAVIKAYNLSTSYALSVGLLADAIAGRPAVAHPWPTSEKNLSGAETRELQTRLKDRGYDVGAVDGMIGEQARAALVRYQAESHVPIDGFPSLALLQRMRSTP